MEKRFRIGEVTGEYYPVIGFDGEHYRNVALYRETDDGFTRIYAIITKDTEGRVDVAWSHEDLTDGRPNPYYDCKYELPGEGFWAVVQEHIAQMNSRDFPPECMEYEF